MNSICIFGGTFNPIHNGHLLIAEEIRNRYEFQKIIFVPSYVSPHKTADGVIDAQYRLTMTFLATVSNPSFDVSDIEVNRGGKSYSIDTVYFFKKVYESVEDCQLYFLIGADILAQLPSWKNIDEIIKMCRFIVVSRKGYNATDIINRMFLSSNATSAAQTLLDNIVIEETNYYDISSSEIRSRIEKRKSIKYLVPESVEQFIYHKHLYFQE
jgi:nicotinate-nucleotide adenylyltransferase